MKIKESYFKEINSPEKAYILGFMYADGYNWTGGKNRMVTISLQEDDVDILEKIQSLLKEKSTIYNIKPNCLNCKPQKRLQINSKSFSEDLKKLGCHQNKSKTLLFPSGDMVNSKFISHFIRGYFDGDGSVWEGKRKKMVVKDKKYGSRERIVHNVKFNITGTTSIIEGIQNILVNNKICKRNKLNTSKSTDNCIQLEYSGRKQMKRFYEFIYKDATIYMNRKKQKFESIICANIQ